MTEGASAQLSLGVKFDDGAEQVVTKGALWTSSDAAIATVDDNGMLTARMHGRVNIVGALKGISVTVPVGVVPDLAGGWAITAPPGDGRWTSLTFAQVTQQGGEISGRWQWDSGVELTLAGTVDEQGDIALAGRECYGGYTYGWVLFEARDWTMAFEGTRGVFEGRVTMSRSGRYIGGVCSGAIVHDKKPTVTKLPISIEVLR